MEGDHQEWVVIAIFIGLIVVGLGIAFHESEEGE